MKKFLTIFALFCLLCVQPVLAEDVKIDTEKSVIKWTGKKVTGAHDGTLAIKSGSVTFTEGIVAGGEFTFDMNAIANKDITDPEYKKKLEDHLKSDDFFSVAEHPEANFKITEVKPVADQTNTYNVSGTLTIKNISHAISFVSKIVKEDMAHRATAQIKFDRTQWDIKYNSGKFFSLAALGDKLIYDEIEVELDLITMAE